MTQSTILEWMNFFVLIVEPDQDRTKMQDFPNTKKMEVDRLIQRYIWKIYTQEDVKADSIVMGGRFILTLKHYGTPHEKAKARFVAQDYNDCDKQFIVDDTCTLRSSSIKLILSSAAIHPFRSFRTMSRKLIYKTRCD